MAHEVNVPVAQFESRAPRAASHPRVRIELSHGPVVQLMMAGPVFGWYHKTTPCCVGDFEYRESNAHLSSPDAYCTVCERRYMPRDLPMMHCKASEFERLFKNDNVLWARLWAESLAARVQLVRELPRNNRDEFEAGLPLLSGPL